MRDYSIKESKEVFEVPQFEEINQCPNKKNSCCDREKIDKLFLKILKRNFFIFEKNITLNKMIYFIIGNFSNF